MPSYFLALLPQLDLEFYRQVERFFELGFLFDLHLPFHVTVYYFREISEHDLIGVSAWMDSTVSTLPSFSAEVQGVDFFRRMEGLESKVNVYYLKVMASQFIQINRSLLDKFPSVTNQDWNYIPHLSLLFPRDLTASKRILQQLNQSFSELKQLEFKTLALFSSQDGAYQLIKKVHL